jgi:hypothetical protein
MNNTTGRTPLRINNPKSAFRNSELGDLPCLHKFPGALSDAQRAGVNRGPRLCVLMRPAHWKILAILYADFREVSNKHAKFILDGGKARSGGLQFQRNRRRRAGALVAPPRWAISLKIG